MLPMMSKAGHSEVRFSAEEVEVASSPTSPASPSLLMSRMPSLPAKSPAARRLQPSVDGNPMIVMKFGGSSLAGAVHLRRVAGIVHSRMSERPVVVLSAMGKTTNELVAAAVRAQTSGEVDISKVRSLATDVLNELDVPVPEEVEGLLQELEQIISGISLLREVSDHTRDRVVSFGERLSVRVFTAWYNKFIQSHEPCEERRIQARALDSWQVGMLTSSGAGSTDSTFSQVEVLPKTYDAISEYMSPLELEYSYVPVVTGYIAKDGNGTITTLGRDGSDLTATIIGASISAKEVQIWKDVDGVLTTDPRVVKEARPLTVLTFEEAAELTVFGATVVHPAAVMPAWTAGVPITVRNSMMPHLPGTRIVADMSEDDIKERGTRVAAMSSKRGITMIVIRSTRMLGQHGFLAHVFNVFKRFEVSVDVIATSEVTVSLTLDMGFKPIDLTALCAELDDSVATVEIHQSMSMLTLISAKKESGGVLRDVFDLFEEIGANVEMVSHGASNVNVTFVLREASLVECTRKLHKAFFEN
jgi:aspartate kinase